MCGFLWKVAAEKKRGTTRNIAKKIRQEESKMLEADKIVLSRCDGSDGGKSEGLCECVSVCDCSKASVAVKDITTSRPSVRTFCTREEKREKP